MSLFGTNWAEAPAFGIYEKPAMALTYTGIDSNEMLIIHTWRTERGMLMGCPVLVNPEAELAKRTLPSIPAVEMVEAAVVVELVTARESDRGTANPGMETLIESNEPQ